MINVMIVDDEYPIREGLKNTVPWERYDMRVIATAENGEEALELAKDCSPDLVVADICMPFVDGLEMAERLMGMRPDTILIFLTCYDEFEYARKALKLGAFDYVLKPVDFDKFGMLLETVRQKYIHLERQRNNIGKAMSDAIHGRGTIAALQDCLMKSGPGIELTYCCILIKLLGFDFAKTVLSSEDLSDYLSQFFTLLRECCSEQELLFEIQEDGRCLLVIGGQGAEKVRQITEQICQGIQMREQLREDYHLLCAISEQVHGENRLREAYLQCRQIIQTSFLYDDTKFICYGDQSWQQGKGEDISALVDSFSNAVRTFDNQAINKTLQEIALLIRSSGRDSILYGHVFVASAYSSLRRISQEMGVKLDTIFPDFSVEYQKMIGINNLSSQIQKIGELTEQLCKIIRANADAPHTSIIQKAQNYLDSHYSDSTLTLQRVASNIHMSPSYFSIVFKQMTGSSFITYLTNLRMERAKYLLQYTSQKAYEISYAVGYDNPTYFSTLFKRRFGCGPIEYRQRFIEEQDQKKM